MNVIQTVEKARSLVDAGEVIAYPTEAVYGLGCDPLNQQAVQNLLALKQRSEAKGLILLIADWTQLSVLIGEVAEVKLDAVRATWPGPVTWVFPKSNQVPVWISGAHETVAIRMTAHPVARALCQAGPIVSTSANIANGAPARDKKALLVFDSEKLTGVLKGDLGGDLSPSEIYRVSDGMQLRGG